MPPRSSTKLVVPQDPLISGGYVEFHAETLSTVVGRAIPEVAVSQYGQDTMARSRQLGVTTTRIDQV